MLPMDPWIQNPPPFASRHWDTIGPQKGPKEEDMDGQIQPAFGQTRPKLGQNWPTPAKFRRRTAIFSRALPNLGENWPRSTWPNAAKLVRTLPNLGQTWSTSANVRPESTNCGRISGESRFPRQLFDSLGARHGSKNTTLRSSTVYL